MRGARVKDREGGEGEEGDPSKDIERIPYLGFLFYEMDDVN